MGHAMNDRQLTEVLIQGYKHPALLFCTGQDIIITGIFGPVTGPDNIMSGFFEQRSGARPCAGIKQKLQLPVSRKGSMRSWLTSRRA